MEDESRLYSIIREIYDVVGAATGCTGWSVEKNIRTVVFRAWKVNRSFLSKLAGYPLTAPPSVSQFIEMLTAYLQRVQERKQGLRDAR